MAMNTLIVGPSSAGKTTALALLGLAGTRYKDLDVVHTNTACADLFIQGPDLLLEGHQLPATPQVTEYTFRLQPRGIGRLLRSTLQYSMLDGPGGALFPNDVSADVAEWQASSEHVELLSRMAEATALELCIDATDFSKARLFAKFLPHLIDSVNLKRPRRMKRVLVSFTKSERLVAQHGARALEELERIDIVEHARRVLSDHGVEALERAVSWPFGKVAFAWSSAYGFLPSQAANYSRTDDSPLLNHRKFGNLAEGDILNRWGPLNLIEPLLFLSAGTRFSGIHIHEDRS